MGTQRIVITLIAGFIAIVAIFAFNPGRAKDPLRVYAWSNYYPEESLRKFTQDSGIEVEISLVSSNEELYAKMKAGATGFDIIHPSDYMVRRMREQQMLAPVDHTQLPNLKNLDDFYRTLAYDPQMRFTVPFAWGTTGIAVNTAIVPVNGEVGWELLLNSPQPKRTSLLDDMREVFGAVFYLQGLGINTEDLGAIRRASNDLAGIKNRVRTFTSEPKPLLLKGEIAVAQIFSLDGLQAGREKPEIQYFIPKEGATLWIDNFAIPKTAEKIREAHIFINYFLDPDHSAPIFAENMMCSPNRLVRERLPEAQRSNPHFYPPPEVMKRLHLIEEPPAALGEMNRLWTELKT